MIRVRKKTSALVYGSYRCLNPDNSTTFQYVRSEGEGPGEIRVLLNFSNETVEVKAPIRAMAREVMNNCATLDIAGENLVLRPYQAVVLRE